MNIDLAQKSKELKDFVSQFEATMFLGDISTVMQFTRSDSSMKSLNGLSSPQRQLLYLAALNVTSAVDEATPLKEQYSDGEFERMKNLLMKLKQGISNFFILNLMMLYVMIGNGKNGSNVHFSKLFQPRLVKLRKVNN